MFYARWSNLKVSSLKLLAPLTVMPTVTIQETLDLLNKEGFDQVPVVDESGYVDNAAFGFIQFVWEIHLLYKINLIQFVWEIKLLYTVVVLLLKGAS